MTDTTRHIVIASGGTGGHFYPTLAIARQLVAKGNEVTLLLAGHHTDEQIEIARRNNLEAQAVKAIRLPRTPLQALAFPFIFLASIWVAWSRLRSLKPNAVLGMGSFASVPVGLAAVLSRRPLFLHEGNAWVGRANRFLSRWARHLATSLPLAPGAAIQCAHRQTGMPLRQSLIDAAEDLRLPTDFLANAGLIPGKPIVLIFGGSQGASAINALMQGVAQQLREDARHLQVIHLTGQVDNAALIGAYSEAGIRACVKERDQQIENCYLAADLVICRSGASTLCELALFKKPGILIPLPTAAEDHQTANAKALASRHAAIHLSQEQATPERIVEFLHDWQKGSKSGHEMGRTVGTLAKPDAARDVAAMVCG